MNAFFERKEENSLYICWAFGGGNFLNIHMSIYAPSAFEGANIENNYSQDPVSRSAL